MRKFIPFTLSISLFLSSTLATAEPAAYLRSDGQFVAHGNEYPRGFWLPSVKGAEQVFAVSAEAAQAYELHKERAKWFSIMAWGGVGAAATYAVVSGDDFQSGVMWTVLLIPVIGSIFFAASSNRQLFKAMNIVNGVPLERARYQMPLPPVAKAQVQVPLWRWTF